MTKKMHTGWPNIRNMAAPRRYILSNYKNKGCGATLSLYISWNHHSNVSKQLQAARLLKPNMINHS